MTPEKLRKAWPDIEAELEVGDIILIHVRSALKNFVRTGVQKATKSYWGHAIVVYATSNDLPLGGTLIVETNPHEGIDMHQFSRYASEPDRYDFGVVRFKNRNRRDRDAFVKNFMVSNIDVPYDIRRIFGVMWRLFLKINRVPRFLYNPSLFICSTFAMRTAQLTSDGTWDIDVRDKTFVPRDLATDDRFIWVFNKNV